jgi:hypothetical protein
LINGRHLSTLLFRIHDGNRGKGYGWK